MTSLFDAFQAQARRTPDGIAVECAGELTTYAALAARADALAARLVRSGAGPDTLVALSLPRSTDLVVALLAVTGAGAAYVPLDPAHPAARNRLILDQARPVTVLDRVPPDGPTGFVAVPPAEETLAYVLFTSGSTGVPKGVAVTHGNLGALLRGFAERLPLSTQDQMLAVTTVGFDIAGLELFGPLLAGARVVLATADEQRDPVRLARILRRGDITVAQATPPLWQAILETGEADLRGVRVVTGGEALREKLAAGLLAGAHTVINGYGPTEATVYATAATVHTAGDAVSIGTPVPGTTAHVLDDALRPTDTGELYLGGAGIARGYLGRPDLTAQRFVADPFGPPGARLYRTGDLVRRRAGGDLEYLGRTDSQVKIRGFRVEPGEVEAVASTLPGVRAAAVVAHEDDLGGRRLVLHAVLDGDTGDLRARLATLLPDHLVPSAVVGHDRLPLTPTGKIDRAALPAPDFGRPAGDALPSGVREEALGALFAEVLGVDRVGAEDGFLDLGGHSLMATRLLGRLRADLGLELTVGEFFAAPTVRAVARRARPAPPLPAPVRHPDRDRVPLSHSQRRLWFLNQLEERGATYTIPLTLHLRGPLDVDALRAALADVVERHESLRTVFPQSESGEPWQRVLSGVVPALPVVHGDTAFPREGVDLATQIPFRAELVVLGRDDHLLHLALHHIAGDGWSLTPLVTDLLAAYAARRSGNPPDLAPLPVRYTDVTLWQRDRDHTAGLDHWRAVLAGLPEQLDLPYDRPRPARASYRGDTVTVTVDAATHDALAALARAEGATVFMAVHAVLAALLTRLGAGTDIPVGTPVAGRDDDALAGLVGFFVNTVVLRADTSGDPAFRALLARVREVDLDALRHRQVPFELLVEALNPARSLARHPLFQVLLVAQHPGTPFAAPGLEVRASEPSLGVAKFDLSFSLTENPGAGIEVVVEFATDVFDRATAERIAGYFLRLLRAAVAEPDRPVGALDMMTAAERRQVLAGWNATTHPVLDRTLPDLLAAQAARTPDAVAVRYEDESVSYADLDARSNRMARLLAGRGVGPETVVALAAPRSVAMLVGMLGVVKAGAAYLPVDPDYPDERVAFMLADSDPVGVLTTAGGTLLLDGQPCDLATHSPAPVTDADRVRPLRPDHPVYVIYTSGSTGRPKGVVLPARAMVNLLAWHATVMGGGVGVTTAQFASLSFDAAAQEIFSALTSGKTLAVPREDVRKDTQRLVRWLAGLRVNELFAPTPVVEGIGEAARELGLDLPDLTDIAQAGEALTFHRAVRDFCAARRVHNYYGPTETHVVTGLTVAAETVERGDTPSIGGPIWNTRCYVLDPALRPVPVGVSGELYLAGRQNARGYLRRPGLTAQRFVADPYAGPGELMYRTGDLARWRPDGTLDFLGRRDFQVKIRGFRVELGEIEVALSRRPEVARVVVVAREDRPGDRRLVAYVVPAGVRPDPTALRRAVATVLPEYMVPAAVVVLDTFPLTPNGKLDRAALPAPDYTQVSRAVPPSGEREHTLARLFADILGVPAVGADDNFFELGGHSLLATRLINRIRTETRCEVTIIDLFDSPTVQGIAQRLREPARPRPTLRRRR
ncbi:hypothetical protein BLA60_02125 [Actinophytocola xinjiangensis]|uniref:Carrier domain-containing protein n=1 Tax=Actinophytocola xinjiangensis TaxID=485602 RepID=A0A7Z0WSN2_9PSEU|nr:non-ribosomal peptide synthetase [Actinophytocola xinjiangensis]OLF13997.1 hypothetical protein BLA60_02125 [Actinophytocola xinjiangensis]